MPVKSYEDSSALILLMSQNLYVFFAVISYVCLGLMYNKSY